MREKEILAPLATFVPQEKWKEKKEWMKKWSSPTDLLWKERYVYIECGSLYCPSVSPLTKLTPPEVYRLPDTMGTFHLFRSVFMGEHIENEDYLYPERIVVECFHCGRIEIFCSFCGGGKSKLFTGGLSKYATYSGGHGLSFCEEFRKAYKGLPYRIYWKFAE